MTRMTGSDALMELLRDEGVEYVFGILGGTEFAILDVIEKRFPDIKYMITLNEVNAVGMAIGYSRASGGKMAVPLLHAAAGLITSYPMLLNAYLGGEPMVVISGQQDTRELLHEPHMSVTGNLTGITSHLTKWSIEVNNAEDIPLAIRRAFKVAKQPPTGPVHVTLPQNIMKESIDFEHVPNAASFTNVHPDTEAISTAVDLLANAKSPVFIVEEGVTKYNALAEMVELAELMGAPVYQPWMADVDFPTNHPQYLGFYDTKNKDNFFATPGGPMALREMLLSADVLVVVGSPLFAQPGHPEKPLITQNTKIIQIDDDPWQIAKNYPIAAGLVGSIKISLVELNSALKSKMTADARRAAKARAATVGKQREEINKLYSDKALREKDNTPIAFSRLARELKNTLQPHTLFVYEAPSYRTDFRLIMDFTEHLSFIGGRGGASIGFGMPAALGVKLAAPDRPVVALIGDGSGMWSNQSLWIAAHYNIPVTYVICANAGYRAGRKKGPDGLAQEGKGANQCTDFEGPRIDFCLLAKSMGISAQKVESPDKLNGVLKSAFSSGKPNLVEVYLEKC